MPLRAITAASTIAKASDTLLFLPPPASPPPLHPPPPNSFCLYASRSRSGLSPSPRPSHTTGWTIWTFLHGHSAPGRASHLDIFVGVRHGRSVSRHWRPRAGSSRPPQPSTSTPPVRQDSAHAPALPPRARRSPPSKAGDDNEPLATSWPPLRSRPATFPNPRRARCFMTTPTPPRHRQTSDRSQRRASPRPSRGAPLSPSRQQPSFSA